MPSENIHSVMDSPEFLPYSTESWFDKEGNLHTQELFETSIRFKKGSHKDFINELKKRAEDQEPSYLEFYMPNGIQSKAEIRGYSTPTEVNPTFDYLDLYIALTKEQEVQIFPNPNLTAEFGY